MFYGRSASSSNVGPMIALLILLVVLGYLWMNRGSASCSARESFAPVKSQPKRENFVHEQVAANARTYTMIPEGSMTDSYPRPDFASMACGSKDSSASVPDALKGMSEEEIQKEIDLHYRKPMELVDTADLLPETDLSGLSYGADPAEDFANKFVWHRTTHARLKRRNWEGGAAMIRGDLIIDPGHESWFQHTNDFRDLTPGFIPKQYPGQIDVEDLTYNMHKVV